MAEEKKMDARQQLMIHHAKERSERLARARQRPVCLKGLKDARQRLMVLFYRGRL